MDGDIYAKDRKIADQEENIRKRKLEAGVTSEEILSAINFEEEKFYSLVETKNDEKIRN